MKWIALETAGVTTSTQIRGVLLKDARMETVLRAVLDEMGGAGASVGYVIDDGVVVISTRADLFGRQYCKTVIYDVRDVMDPGQSRTYTDPGPDAGRFRHESPVEKTPGQELCRLVAGTVDRDSWMDPWGAGNVGSMQVYGGLLIVQQTPENHQKIAALLADIRRHKPTFR